MACKLKFFYGAMNSGKSLLLLATAHNIEENGLNLMILKPSIDTRDGNDIIKSRLGVEHECVMVDKDVNLYEAIKVYRNVLASRFQKLNWVLIDESQFLTEEQVDQLADAADYLNVNVMCFGLRTDFQSHLFPGSKRLFEIADDLEEIKSTCRCGEKKTSMNARVDDMGNIITSGSQIEIGGNDKYISLCRKCWRDKLKEKKMEEYERLHNT